MTNQTSEKNKITVNPTDLPVPDTLPVLPVHGFVFFPGMGFPIQVSHPASKKLIDDVLLKERLIAIVSHKTAKKVEEKLDTDNLYSVGVMGYIHKMNKGVEGFYHVLVSAVQKIKVIDFIQGETYPIAKVELIELKSTEDTEEEALILNLNNQFKKLIELANLPPEIFMTLSSVANSFHLAYIIISQLNLPLELEQQMLEIEDSKTLLRRVTKELANRLETVEMSNKIQKDIKDDMGAKQKEFFLRQQLKSIRKELGEGEEENVELKELKKKLSEASLSDEARKTAEKELDRLERIPAASAEYTVCRNYLDWLLDLPWEKSSTDNLDINLARQHLDEDHYGLKKIKKRILEFLAVRKLKQDMHGPILCFTGPPGTGKTSLGKSIARTMGREFIRISLGGVRDEAEIRGHRRTYIGALPGRIIQSIRKAGTNNPLFMLDEIDKLGMDFRGDPSSALLEVLDPEQNYTFVDHYIEIAFDLSKVMFITTANVLGQIPGPLRDRMEVIELSGYTVEEKLMIAKQFLVPKELEAHGVTENDLQIEDEAIRTIIQSYTREAGVRNLERELASICRKVATEIVSGHIGQTRVKAKNLDDFLGSIKFFPEITARSWGPGLVTGLAWTPVGGTLLFIESAGMEGKGSLTLTGMLGDVMKESATAALTYIRSHMKTLNIPDIDFSKRDIHIHVPEGAIPKDGPSAGVAMVVCLASLLTGRPVRRDLAMTGEITLRGDVLPVGGIKEKVLAASGAGIKEIILPNLNKKDEGEIPDNVKKGVSFHFVQKIEEVLELALPE
ncbi:MAG: endopeptidase La [Thermodesulfobacteriota bacterium]|nr:endopeptidase La [Thermodesulfobacteriota bacterium]